MSTKTSYGGFRTNEVVSRPHTSLIFCLSFASTSPGGGDGVLVVVLR